LFSNHCIILEGSWQWKLLEFDAPNVLPFDSKSHYALLVEQTRSAEAKYLRVKVKHQTFHSDDELTERINMTRKTTSCFTRSSLILVTMKKSDALSKQTFFLLCTRLSYEKSKNERLFLYIINRHMQ